MGTRTSGNLMEGDFGASSEACNKKRGTRQTRESWRDHARLRAPARQPQTVSATYFGKVFRFPACRDTPTFFLGAIKKTTHELAVSGLIVEAAGIEPASVDRTEQSLYKRSPGFEFIRRPVPERPTDGLALLKCRAAGEWLSLGAEPERWRR